MEYKISISNQAQIEIENAINYYALISSKTQRKFVLEIIEVYSILATNPFFSIKYKNIRSVQINKFPYSLYYTINSRNKSINVLACFHQKKHPNKQPRK
ncbi:MAG: type II toxin-antitoxin system RelE/ParE family toxin [Aquirufa sp.]